jgi:hypothetical protein
LWVAKLSDYRKEPGEGLFVFGVCHERKVAPP